MPGVYVWPATTSLAVSRLAPPSRSDTVDTERDKKEPNDMKEEGKKTTTRKKITQNYENLLTGRR
jgi:hypothetical protein